MNTFDSFALPPRPDLLERAIQLAASGHAGQPDKAGQPYILHPLRVMLRLESEAERIVGVLHDLLEDTTATGDSLRAEGFDEDVVSAIEALTKRDGESYEDFILRVGTNPLAARVKLADLEDNMDLERIPSPTDEDHRRVAKYQSAKNALLALGHELPDPPDRRREPPRSDSRR